MQLKNITAESLKTRGIEKMRNVKLKKIFNREAH